MRLLESMKREQVTSARYWREALNRRRSVFRRVLPSPSTLQKVPRDSAAWSAGRHTEGTVPGALTPPSTLRRQEVSLGCVDR